MVEFPIFVKICCTEIGLCFTWSVLKRNVTSCFVKIEFFFPLSDVKGNQSVAAGKILVFAFQALVDPFGSMALFSWSELIRFHPAVNLRFERIKFGTMLLIPKGSWWWTAKIFHIHIFAYCTPVAVHDDCNFVQIFPLLIEEFSDTMNLIHCSHTPFLLIFDVLAYNKDKGN